MKILCKSDYANQPAGLFFSAGLIEVDEKIYEFLKKDAPENFEVAMPQVLTEAAPPSAKAFDAPPADKAVKAPSRKK